MGTVKWTSIPDERPPHGWNLDFLTPDEKASIKQVLEFARRKIVFFDINFVYVAKYHYEEDRGYTKGDIVVIVLALGWLKNYVGANVSFDEGEEVESVLGLPELAETIKEKIKQEYKLQS